MNAISIGRQPLRVCVLGATGSIGVSTLDVIARHPDQFQVAALSAYSRIDLLVSQAQACNAPVVVVPDDEARARFFTLWPAGRPAPDVLVGAQALVDVAADAGSDTVMAAIVGTAGLPSALAAARAGKRLLLANKEALVASGGLFMAAVRDHGAQLLPIDSEHNAIFQCLPPTADPHRPAPGVRQLWLTASGGPFRTLPLEALVDVAPEQACAHPNWRMGRKISVDSATMLNKGLEVIEAHWLFGMPADRIRVVIHPQSTVHSLVEYDDGSILAQMGQPDMRIPIAHGLGYPTRIASGAEPLDLTRLGRLDFEAPDLRRFPCLGLAFDALVAGQAACVTLNAANEVAVARFLSRGIRYTDIARVIEQGLSAQAGSATHALDSLDAVLALDAEARRHAEAA